MHPVLIDFGFFKLHTYGLMIALAFLVGMQLASREARRVDRSPAREFDKFILDLCFYILVWAMVGSRLLFIIVNWDDYAHDLGKIIRIWEGGLVFYGGLIGATAFSIYYTRKHQYDFFQIADILIPYVALGSMFGRIGCFAAGCCWGSVVDSDFALGVQFPRESLAFGSMVRTHLVGASDAFTPHVHPVQMYDACGELVIFVLLSLVRLRKRFHGQIFLTFMFVYPLWRSTVETFRGDKERGTGVLGTPLSTSQFISACVALAAIATLIYLRRRLSESSAPAEAAA